MTQVVVDQYVYLLTVKQQQQQQQQQQHALSQPAGATMRHVCA